MWRNNDSSKRTSFIHRNQLFPLLPQQLISVPILLNTICLFRIPSTWLTPCITVIQLFIILIFCQITTGILDALLMDFKNIFGLNLFSDYLMSFLSVWRNFLHMFNASDYVRSNFSFKKIILHGAPYITIQFQNFILKNE